MPAKLGDIITDQVRDLWANHPNWNGVRVHKEMKKRNGGTEPISVRKVQEIIRDAKKADGDAFKPFPLVLWKQRWSDKNPAVNAFLLTMDAVCQLVQLRSLYDHEAKWGKSLRVALQGLMPYDQFCFISIYAQREMVNFYLNEPEAGYAALDAILTYKPWLPENAHAYGVLALTGLVKKPAHVSEAMLSFEDAVENLTSGKAWEAVRMNLRLPWYVYPEDVQPGSYEEYFFNPSESDRKRLRERNKYTEEVWKWRARDTALQFWMGDNPIFEKPQTHGAVGLIEIRRSNVEDSGESNTHEEAPE